MKRLFFALILCGAVCCLSSCEKIGDDGNDGESGPKPIEHGKSAIINDSIIEIERK